MVSKVGFWLYCNESLVHFLFFLALAVMGFITCVIKEKVNEAENCVFWRRMLKLFWMLLVRWDPGKNISLYTHSCSLYPASLKYRGVNNFMTLSSMTFASGFASLITLGNTAILCRKRVKKYALLALPDMKLSHALNEKFNILVEGWTCKKIHIEFNFGFIYCVIGHVDSDIKL